MIREKGLHIMLSGNVSPRPSTSASSITHDAVCARAYESAAAPARAYMMWWALDLLVGVMYVGVCVCPQPQSRPVYSVLGQV